MPPTAELPWPARVRLAHAALQATAERANADALLIKGYATDSRLYFPGRSSTDVDVLVRPGHVSRLVRELESLGWKTLTTFWSGSIFHHAQTMRHPAWGLVDIHRTFPGLDGDPEDTFQDLWRERITRPIAGYPCDVPSLLDQALVIIVHSARNTLTIHQDVAHLRSVLGPQDWQALQARAESLGATLAFAAATGQLHRYRDHPSHDLWTVLSQGGTRSQEWRARMRAATTFRDKAQVALSAPLPNIDHLRMDLNREPTAVEIARATLNRPVLALRELITGRAARRPDRTTQDARATGADDAPVPSPVDPDTQRLSTDPRTEPPGALAGLLTLHSEDVTSGTSAGPFPSTDSPPPTTGRPEPTDGASSWAGDARALRPAPNVAVVDDIPAEESVDASSPVYVARVPKKEPRVLEGSAAVIWRTAVSVPPENVVTEVADLIGLSREDIETDVVEFLRYLSTEKLLVNP